MRWEEHMQARKILVQRYIKDGLDGFLDFEILELVLAISMPHRNNRIIALILLDKYKTLSDIHEAPIKDLLEIPGMTTKAAVMLRLLRDLCSFLLKEKTIKKKVSDCGLDLVNYLRLLLRGRRDETFITVFLNSQLEIIDIEDIQSGTVNEATIYPRKIIERALFHNATGLILAHNHPGGTPKPSRADEELTQMLVFAAGMMDIDILDHLIFTDNELFSFKEQGLLNLRFERRKIACLMQERGRRKKP
jgi:DNA repair protein RadC